MREKKISLIICTEDKEFNMPDLESLVDVKVINDFLCALRGALTVNIATHDPIIITEKKLVPADLEWFLDNARLDCEVVENVTTKNTFEVVFKYL